MQFPESLLPVYEVIIVGGGPAALGAASALGRVRRFALSSSMAGFYRTKESELPVLWWMLMKLLQVMHQPRRSTMSLPEMVPCQLSSEF